MLEPPITLTCDCGAIGKAAYGERWTCAQCGRLYDTAQIPREQYQAIRRVALRYRLIGFAFGALLAIFVLWVILQDQPLMLIATLPLILMAWFFYGRPLLRRSYRRAIARMPRWDLRAEGE